MVAITHTHLIEGEVFTLKNKNDEKQVILLDEDINIKYRKGEMRIVTEQGRINHDSIVTTLESVQGEKKKYILNPEYQRRKRWNNKRKSLLIESFIINVPIPPIFLYEVEYARYEVMDGLQRLTAIYDFYKGNFPLEGLEYWKELNGRTYNELPENVRAGIDRRYLSSIILLEETAKNPEEAEFLKQIVFERLNSGGEKLTPQETRNALHNGDFNRLCLTLAKNESFRKMWHYPLMRAGEKELLKSDAYREMKDVELVLRFFAYRHVGKLTSPIDKFLDKFLRQANNFPKFTMDKLEEIFIETVDLVYTILEEKAFLLPQITEHVQKAPRVNVYDGVMQAFARNLEYKSELLRNKNQIKENLYKDESLLYRQKERNPYLFDGRYNNRIDVQARIEYFHNYLQNYIS